MALCSQRSSRQSLQQWSTSRKAGSHFKLFVQASFHLQDHTKWQILTLSVVCPSLTITLTHRTLLVCQYKSTDLLSFMLEKSSTWVQRHPATTSRNNSPSRAPSSTWSQESSTSSFQIWNRKLRITSNITTERPTLELTLVMIPNHERSPGSIKDTWYCILVHKKLWTHHSIWSGFLTMISATTFLEVQDT